LRVESLPGPSNADVTIKRLELDFLSTAIDISCNAFVEMDCCTRAKEEVEQGTMA